MFASGPAQKENRADSEKSAQRKQFLHSFVFKGSCFGCRGNTAALGPNRITPFRGGCLSVVYSPFLGPSASVSFSSVQPVDPVRRCHSGSRAFSAPDPGVQRRIVVDGHRLDDGQTPPAIRGKRVTILPGSLKMVFGQDAVEGR